MLQFGRILAKNYQKQQKKSPRDPTHRAPRSFKSIRELQNQHRTKLEDKQFGDSSGAKTHMTDDKKGATPPSNVCLRPAFAPSLSHSRGGRLFVRIDTTSSSTTFTLIPKTARNRGGGVGDAGRRTKILVSKRRAISTWPWAHLADGGRNCLGPKIFSGRGRLRHQTPNKGRQKLRGICENYRYFKTRTKYLLKISTTINVNRLNETWTRSVFHRTWKRWLN